MQENGNIIKHNKINIDMDFFHLSLHVCDLMFGSQFTAKQGGIMSVTVNIISMIGLSCQMTW